VNVLMESFSFSDAVFFVIFLRNNCKAFRYFHTFWIVTHLFLPPFPILLSLLVSDCLVFAKVFVSPSFHVLQLGSAGHEWKLLILVLLRSPWC
jgi:hypothetical protein